MLVEPRLGKIVKLRGPVGMLPVGHGRGNSSRELSELPNNPVDRRNPQPIPKCLGHMDAVHRLDVDRALEP